MHFLGFDELSFQLLAFRDAAQVALNKPLLVHQIGAADELDLDPPPVFRLQGQPLVANPVGLLQLGKSDFGSILSFEWADFPQFPAQKFFLRVAEQILHERIGVHHLPGHGVENEDAVGGRFKQPPVTQFGGAYRLSTPCLRLFRPHFRLLCP